jgi:hypothetical protein
LKPETEALNPKVVVNMTGCQVTKGEVVADMTGCQVTMDEVGSKKCKNESVRAASEGVPPASRRLLGTV